MKFAFIVIILFSLFDAISEGRTTASKRPVEALQVAQQFVDAINESQFNEAYGLTDKSASISPECFSSLRKFTERARHERPFSEDHPGKSQLQTFKFISAKTLRVEFSYQFEVRLCRQVSNSWKVCYFQTHAG